MHRDVVPPQDLYYDQTSDTLVAMLSTHSLALLLIEFERRGE